MKRLKHFLNHISIASSVLSSYRVLEGKQKIQWIIAKSLSFSNRLSYFFHLVRRISSTTNDDYDDVTKIIS